MESKFCYISYFFSNWIQNKNSYWYIGYDSYVYIILNNVKIITIYHKYKLKAIFVSLLYLVKKTIGLLVVVQFVV